MAPARTRSDDVESGRSERRPLLDDDTQATSSVSARAVGRAILVGLVGACAVLSASQVAVSAGGRSRVTGASRLGYFDPSRGRDLTPVEFEWKEQAELADAERAAKATDALLADIPRKPLAGHSEPFVGTVSALGAVVNILGGADGPSKDADGRLVNVPEVRGVYANLDEVANKLGSTSGVCPNAFVSPVVGEHVGWTPAYLAALDLADHLYVVCVDCGKVRIPERLASKTTLVDGLAVDGCVKAGFFGLQHYQRASFTHAFAAANAIVQGHDKAAVVEEDSVSPEDSAADLSGNDLADFASAMTNSDWSFLRLGWRQYTLELQPKLDCPRECACTPIADKLCYVTSGGCDLRSSDSYVVSRRYMKWLMHSLITGGIVDYNVLPSAPGTLLAMPLLSVQAHLDIPGEHQSAIAKMFWTKCAKKGSEGFPNAPEA